MSAASLPTSPPPPLITHLLGSAAPRAAPPTADQKIYVLSADGSSLFLLDPTTPGAHEEPPPYAAVPQRASGNARSGLGLDGTEEGVGAEADTEAEGDRDAAEGGTAPIGRSRSSSGLVGHRPPPVFPGGQRAARAPHGQPGAGPSGHAAPPAWIRSPGAGRNAVFLPEVRIDTVPTMPRSSAFGPGPASVDPYASSVSGAQEANSSRHRASTLSSLPPQPSARAGLLGPGPSAPVSEPRSRPRYRAEQSYSSPSTQAPRQPYSPTRPPGSSSLGSTGMPRPAVARSRSSLSSISSRPSRPRTRSSAGRPDADETTPLLFSASDGRLDYSGGGGLAGPGPDELEADWEVLPLPAAPSARGLWRSIFCGDLDLSVPADLALISSTLPLPGSTPGPLPTTTLSAAPSTISPAAPHPHRDTWSASFRRYWRPVARPAYWRAAVHLALLNFPLALAVWPLLVAGTLAGTALLITLPLGAVVWWLTLILSRTWARLELRSQVYWHGSRESRGEADGWDGWDGPEREGVIWRPVFYRVKVGASPVGSPGTVEAGEWLSPRGVQGADGGLGAVAGAGVGGQAQVQEQGQRHGDIKWEKRFMKCSYAMFSDHSSYSALCYFLLIKPLITLPTLVIFAGLFFPALVLVVPFPVYLRAARHWGRWQATIAIENL